LLDITIKEAYLIDVAIPNNQDLHSTSHQEAPYVYSLERRAISCLLHKVAENCALLGYYTVSGGLKLLNLFPVLFILPKKHIVRKLLQNSE
jgi:hypothetical protein